ncbi:MAG: alpha/beta fold hydrolase [Rhodobacterales bacterium]|nr:alpha/beta fold hydrolase [Rhodobacterales bacterium]
MISGPCFLALAICVLLTGCAPRGTIKLDPEAAGTGSKVEILVATTRGASQTETFAARARSDTVRWGVLEVSVPPDRTPGTVTFPRAGQADPKTDFLTTSAKQIADEQAFLSALNARLAKRRPGDREVTLFVHGFNTNFAEGVYRQAQMAHDFKSPGVSVSYSWPSAANVFAYGFDLESALFARDGLERVLRLLARSNAEGVVVVGHSMGTVVVLETLRQIAIRGSDTVLGHIRAVLLIAPDLDPELFRQEVLALAPQDLPIYVTVSGRDRALRVSGLLRGQSERLGSIADTSSVAALPGVVVIDLSDVQGADDPLNHFAVATSPAMIAYIQGLDRVGVTMLRDAERTTSVFEASVEAAAGVAVVTLRPIAD